MTRNYLWYLSVPYYYKNRLWKSAIFAYIPPTKKLPLVKLVCYPSRGQWKIISDWIPSVEEWISWRYSLCCYCKCCMIFHRGHPMKLSLDPFTIVVVDIFRNHFDKCFPWRKTSSIIPLTFQNAPETFHRPVVDTMGYPGHALLHMVFLQSCAELLTGVLKSTVWIILNSA